MIKTSYSKCNPFSSGIQVEQWHVRATIEARHIDQTGTYVFHFPYPDKLIIKKPDGKKLTFHPRKKK
jgi:hypothetical protein